MLRTIKLLLYFFIYQLAVSGACSVFFMLWNHSLEIPDPSSKVYVTFLLSVQVVFTILLSAHLVFWKYVKLDRHSLAYYNSFKVMSLSLLFIVGLGLWNNYLSELFDLPNTMEQFFVEMMRHPLGIFATVVMAPIMEELLFRGAIEGHLLRTWKNPAWAILLSSVLFGAVHGNPAQIPFAIIIGLALGWVYYKTGSLVPCIFMHFVNNGCAVLAFWISGSSETTLIGTYGYTGATFLAIFGVGITILSVVFIRKVLKDQTFLWRKEVD